MAERILVTHPRAAYSTARHAASDVLSDTVPRTGHDYAAENPGWTVERLHRFFSDSDA